MQMRWGRYRVKSARLIAGGIEWGNIPNAEPQRSERALAFR
jgi:hypothetical protein